jgi:Ca2+-dependent lipid-binding protein
MVYVPVEVTDIVMKAESRITIKPLVETLPCLGSVSVSLLKVYSHVLRGSLCAESVS